MKRKKELSSLSAFLKRPVLFFLMAGFALACLYGGAAFAAPPLVKKIETRSGDGKFTLQVFLNSRLAPKIFPLDAKGDNPRVVVDFPKASGLKSLPARIDSGSDLVRAVRVGIHKGKRAKVRLVLDLVPGFVYQVEQWFRRDINSYILVLTAQ